MITQIGESATIHVSRPEANFDRACDQAWRHAVGIAQIDEYGHSAIEGWCRTNCSVEVDFVGYKRSGCELYNASYGDDRICECGHSYIRHFDHFEEEDDQDAGCKYCCCDTFKEANDDTRTSV